MIRFILIMAMLVAAYIYLVRPVLRKYHEEWFTEADGFWLRMRTTLEGLRTKLVARSYVVIGAFVSMYDFVLPYVMGVDWAPLSAKVPMWVWPLIAVGSGLLFGYLRSISKGPAAE